MKYISYLLIAIACPLLSKSQDITGLWKGHITNDTTREQLVYEVLISKEKGRYNGYSHTWFKIGDQQYYGVKKLKIHIARDKKIIIQDWELLEHNYPMDPHKYVRQLNVLDLAAANEELAMSGPFVTNRTKEYKSLTGQVSLKKMTDQSQGEVVKYLAKSVNGNLAMVKKK